PRDTGDRFDYEGCGQEVQVEHIKAYVCKPPANTGKALIVIHDMLGRQLPNTRYTADMLTTNGYSGICPLSAAMGRQGWAPPSISYRQFTRFKCQLQEADAALKYLKEQCGAKKLGIIGFCWGGVSVRHLMMTHWELKVGVSLYYGSVIKDSDDLSNLLNPIFFIFAERCDF
ncbi:CMBL Carboxymethylenebutenolidase, partial [Piprites chloris]|nr:CMBL Carboxymethylenebutenolidase [Piprites chloris]